MIEASESLRHSEYPPTIVIVYARHYLFGVSPNVAGAGALSSVACTCWFGFPLVLSSQHNSVAPDFLARSVGGSYCE